MLSGRSSVYVLLTRLTSFALTMTYWLPWRWPACLGLAPPLLVSFMSTAADTVGSQPAREIWFGGSSLQPLYVPAVGHRHASREQSTGVIRALQTVAYYVKMNRLSYSSHDSLSPLQLWQFHCHTIHILHTRTIPDVNRPGWRTSTYRPMCHFRAQPTRFRLQLKSSWW